ncbi:MAG: gamma-glutamyltransferase [Rhodocyclaceae bacterium]|nr:gamma-glutamyltransferase [Rhodocyclaceae bacterium]
MIPRPARRRWCTALAAILAGLLGACAQISADRFSRSGVPGIVAGEPGFAGGVVSVSHPLAAEAGASVLRTGGNAIDAAAAILFALNVVEPQSSGIGGGGFMMIHLRDGDRTLVVDSRETAPAAATADMFAGMDFRQASTSGIAVGVPGMLRGIELALDRWGSIPLAQALAPAIALARDGFTINTDLARRTGLPRTALQPETAARFRRKDGSPLPEGHRLVQPELARTLALVAAQGSEVFYRGEIARAIVAAQRRSPIGETGRGRMTLDDLATYRPRIRAAVEGNYRGFTLRSMPPPSSGGLTLLMMLRLLEPYPIGGDGDGWGFGGRHTLHLMTEVMRIGFADRAVWMGDDDFVPVPAAGLLSDCFLSARGALLAVDARMMNAPEAADPWPCQRHGAMRDDGTTLAVHDEEKGIDTTHFTVVDHEGNVVSFTATIESAWGSGITVPGYGFLLNNELTDFNLVPRANPASGNPGSNDVAPGKRPRSSMAPTMVFRNGELVLAYGSPGGATIINSVLNTTLNLIDHRMSLQQAISAPRLSVTSPAGTIQCEEGLPQASLDHLARLGHEFRLDAGGTRCTANIGSVQAIAVEPERARQHGAADARREGTVIGLP